MPQIVFGKKGTSPYGLLTLTQVASNIASNTSTLNIELELKRPFPILDNTVKRAGCKIGEETYTFEGPINGVGPKMLISEAQTINHDEGGNKTIFVSAAIALDLSVQEEYIGTISAAVPIVLKDITDFATVEHFLVSKTETEITVNWASNSEVNYVWYSTDDGSSWVGEEIDNQASGSYVIENLDSNTEYKIKTRIQKKENGLISETSALDVTTYDFPNCLNAPDFTIGDVLKIGLYNPLNRNVVVSILDENNNQICEAGTSEETISGFDDETSKSSFYATIPNATSGTYRVKVAYGQHESTKSGATYKANLAECYPTIGNVTYQDTSSLTTAVTGDNQYIVRGKSSVAFQASGLSAKNSATISSCSAFINGESYGLAIAGSTAILGGVTIDSAVDLIAIFKVVDSRGLIGIRMITIKMLDWERPTAIISLSRQDSVLSETDITVNVKYSPVNNNNTVTIAYSATKEGDSTPSISGTLQNNVRSTFVADARYGWSVRVTLTDRLLGIASYVEWLPRGTPLLFLDRSLKSVGIDCFPQDQLSIEIGGHNILRTVLTRSLSANQTNLSGIYSLIALDSEISSGGRLSATNSGGIKIGPNISQVLVSGRMALKSDSTSGTRSLRISKSLPLDANTIAFAQKEFPTNSLDIIEITPTLANVQENDVIYLFYLVPSSFDEIIGGTFGAQTSLTVDVVK